MNEPHYDAVIVLGAGLNPDGSFSDLNKVRLEKAAELYSNRTTKAIIVCGSHSYKAVDTTEMSEAQAYAEFLYGIGVPKDGVYLEAESMESLGNLLFAKMHIIMEHDWRKLLVIPTVKHSTERIEYLLKKIFGAGYEYEILRVGENKEPENVQREAKALNITKDINDKYADGDHQAIYDGLRETHPAYGGTKWTVDELREMMRQQDTRPSI